MREGRIVQVGSPRELYDKPKNRYVADFVGKSNFFKGTHAGTATSIRPEMIELAKTQKNCQWDWLCLFPPKS